MLGYVIVNQASTTIILKISNLALHDGGSGPIVYNNAYLIFMMANGIVAVSIMTALMPRMSAAAAQKRHDDLKGHLSLGIRLSSVILIPATVAYLILGRQLAVTIFDWGKYSQHDAIATGWVIAAAGLGLVPYAITQMQLFAFYAMPDTKTPTLLNVPIAVFRVLLIVGFCFILPAAWVNASLMVGMTISYVVCAILGNRLLRKRIGNLGFGPVLRTLVRLALAAVVAAIPTALLALIIQHTLGPGKTGSVVGLLLGPVLQHRVGDRKQLGPVPLHDLRECICIARYMANNQACVMLGFARQQGTASGAFIANRRRRSGKFDGCDHARSLRGGAPSAHGVLC